jgi:hypothetical protein
MRWRHLPTRASAAVVERPLTAETTRPCRRQSWRGKRYARMLSLLFTFGGLNLTTASLERVLAMPEVKRLLDADVLKTRQELVDANTATAMLQAAKRFFNEILASKVRRTDVERNVFWAGIVALILADLIENRQGRAMMRILELPYRTIKRANRMRKEKDGRLMVRVIPCACRPCTSLRWPDCEMKFVVGEDRQVTARHGRDLGLAADRELGCVGRLAQAAAADSCAC